MTAKELIEELEYAISINGNNDVEVRTAQQPKWAFEYTIEWSGAIVTGVWKNIPYITSGSGTLIVLELTGTPTGLSGIVILDPSGDNLNFTFDNIGCMDNGYQQWSPNPGSPACNYAPFAIIDDTLNFNMKLRTDEVVGKISGIIEEVKHVNGTLISIWHNDTFSDEGVWKGWRNVYEDMVKLIKV